jgi:hypothetical protein
MARSLPPIWLLISAPFGSAAELFFGAADGVSDGAGGSGLIIVVLCHSAQLIYIVSASAARLSLPEP